MSDPDDPQDPELRQAIVCGSAPVGGSEIAGAALIVASMFGAPPQPDPPKPPKKQTDEDADAHVFHGEADYR